MTSNLPPRIIHDILLDMQKLAPALEKKRRAYNLSLLIGVFVIVGALYALLSYLTDPRLGSQIAMIGVAFLPSYILYRVLNHLYGKAVHRAFIKAVCKQGVLSYSELGFFESREIEHHKILPHALKSVSGEGIKGTYQSITFVLQEISLRNKGDTAFWGIAARIYLSHAFEGHTVMIPHGRHMADFLLRFPNWKKINTMSAKYAPYYEGLTSDPVEARAVLPPHFMERLMDAGQLPRGKMMSLSLTGREILLAYPRFRPLFVVPALWQPVSLAAMQRCIWEIESIFRVIDVIKSNRQIRT
ncbi:MAG: DUF3137 domain-containing protein [Micavibrio aeruginosavorus]|uniref:DUF3137 domain-containing protein n=1 Tax=Micavibrio aeruginosavorus TaxID=349221 RepID=A0A7T5UHR9_9BACT|nr:MAG: DUF3137 domain-containing protein [Micavibrio aeruginosavorus]